MDTQTLELLDYFRVRNDVASYCMSAEGKALLEKRLPFTTKEQVARHKEESRQWFRYITVKGGSPLTGWGECTPLLTKLGVTDYALDVESIAVLGGFCKAEIHTKQTLLALENDEHLNLSLLEAAGNQLPDLESQKNAIYRVIDESGMIRDLPELRAIRSEIRRKQNEIDAIIKSYTTDNSLASSLQSNIPVLRGDRQVLAVKSSAKSRIPGIVHEMSQTGQTCFIEPADLVIKNNELVQEQFRLSQAIHNILKALTAELGSGKDNLETALTLMARLDASLASARWGLAVQGTYAFDLPDEEGQVAEPTFHSPILIKARHPLLGSRAVPITVQFQREANNCHGHRMLIITGPNTGGKTVTLKTIALLAMLNQSGFPIPAAEGTALPIFTGVYADIGDEQNMDQNLSTFSGHMKNVATILEHADADSLVLLDELGSGTDPQEGGAIAMAVLDELIKRDSFVLVTTHHGILKNYGYTHPSVTNASVEFGTETLAPTYRILMGVPGESHALDIARRSGLPAAIADQAEQYISNNQADISALIRGLNAKHEELAKRETEFAIKERDINERWRKVDLKNLRLKQHELELREQGYRKSRDFVDKSRSMLENLVRELREGEVTREKTLKVKETIAELTRAVEEEQASLQAEQDALPKELLPGAKRYVSQADGKAQAAGVVSDDNGELSYLEPGTDVIHARTRQTGTVASIAKKGNSAADARYVVMFGSMKMTVKACDIQVAQKQSKPSVSVELSMDSGSEMKSGSADGRVQFGVVKNDRPVLELRLLGMRYEEAEKALDRQLDLCCIHNMKSFSIIHGKGNGVLQQMVQSKLKGYNAVSEYHFAKPEDGGFGKTYVTLK